MITYTLIWCLVSCNSIERQLRIRCNRKDLSTRRREVLNWFCSNFNILIFVIVYFSDKRVDTNVTPQNIRVEWAFNSWDKHVVLIYKEKVQVDDVWRCRNLPFYILRNTHQWSNYYINIKVDFVFPKTIN